MYWKLEQEERCERILWKSVSQGKCGGRMGNAEDTHELKTETDHDCMFLPTFGVFYCRQVLEFKQPWGLAKLIHLSDS